MPQEYGSEARSSALPQFTTAFMSEFPVSVAPRSGKKRSKTPIIPRLLLSVSTAALYVALFGPGPIAYAQQSRSLPETIEKSVLSHPEVQARYHDFLSTLEGKNIERGALRPQVSAEG